MKYQHFFPGSTSNLESPLNGSKLIGVGIGDMVQLINSLTGGSVAGYVAGIHSCSIDLSHEDPYFRSKHRNDVAGLHDYHKFFPGDRTYELRKFDKFEILHSTSLCD